MISEIFCAKAVTRQKHSIRERESERDRTAKRREGMMETK